MKKVILGSRGSILALAQTEWVKSELERYFPDIICEIKIIKTQGDKDLTSHFGNSKVSLKSFFTKEIEQDLLDNKIDIAVHSMKDMPSVSPKGLICGAIPRREDARDVIVSNSGTLAELPKGAIIGTSSLRRVSNITSFRDDFQVKPLRGNIHTRIKKLRDGEYDAIVLAAAGLIRSGLKDEITEYLDPKIFSPAPAQGALYIQCREGDEVILNLLEKIHDEETAKVVAIEREFSKIFDGGCHTPMGCYSEIVGEDINFYSMYSHNGKNYMSKICGKINHSDEIAKRAADDIKRQMGEN